MWDSLTPFYKFLVVFGGSCFALFVGFISGCIVYAVIHCETKPQPKGRELSLSGGEEIR